MKPHSTTLRLASTLVEPISVQTTTAGRTGCEVWHWQRLMAKSSSWSIGRQRSCGVLGEHCITPDRLWASASRSDHQGLADKLQQRAHGGLSRALQRRLQTSQDKFEKGPVLFDPGGALRTGATLVRQWRGQTHTVLVREDGFEGPGTPLSVADGDCRADHRDTLVRSPVLWRVQVSVRTVTNSEILSVPLRLRLARRERS